MLKLNNYNLEKALNSANQSILDMQERRKALENINIVTKKDGKPFAIFSKNFENVKITSDEIHPEMILNYKAGNTYKTHSFSIYEYCKNLPEEHPQKHNKAIGIYRAVAKMSIEEVQETIKKEIEYTIYNETRQKEIIEKIEVLAAKYSKMFDDMNEEFKNDVQGNDSLKYSLKECFV